MPSLLSSHRQRHQYRPTSPEYALFCKLLQSLNLATSSVIFLIPNSKRSIPVLFCLLSWFGLKFFKAPLLRLEGFILHLAISGGFERGKGRGAGCRGYQNHRGMGGIRVVVLFD